MGNIFEINQKYLEIFEAIEENDGVIEGDLEEQLSSNEEELQEKLNNTISMISKWEGDISVIDSEIMRLKRLQESKRKSIDALKNNISASLQLRGIDKMDLGTHKLSFRKSDQIVVVDQQKIPQQFLSQKITISVDKMALKKYIKDGNSVDGIELVENLNLQIK